MTRDWDVIREILIKLEDSTSPSSILQLSDFPSEQRKIISYHSELLIEAGLINGEMIKTMGRETPEFLITRLTWNGHEFLDTIKNDTVWTKTKKSFNKSGISMSFEIIKSVATDTATTLVKSALGT